MMIDAYKIGCQEDKKEIEEIISLLKSRLPKRKAGDFYIKGFHVNHMIEGSGMMEMSYNMCRALVLFTFDKQETTGFDFAKNNLQVVFPEWVIDARTNEERPPIWCYTVNIGCPREYLELKMVFYQEKLLSEAELKQYILENVNWNCSTEHQGM